MVDAKKIDDGGVLTDANGLYLINFIDMMIDGVKDLPEGPARNKALLDAYHYLTRRMIATGCPVSLLASATLSLAGEDAGGLCATKLRAAISDLHARGTIPKDVEINLTGKVKRFEGEVRNAIRSLSLRVEAEKRERAEAERERDVFLSETVNVSDAIGSTRFLDPPDGGGVTLAVQVSRMRKALEAAETHSAALARALEEIYRVGDGYGAHRPEQGKHAGTTGEGHARCREIANSALEGHRRARSLLAPKEDTDA